MRKPNHVEVKENLESNIRSRPPEEMKKKESLNESLNPDDTEIQTKKALIETNNIESDDIPSNQSFLTSFHEEHGEVTKSLALISTELIKKKFQELSIDGLVLTDLDGAFEKDNSYQVIILVILSLTNNKSKFK
jgi:hypothetical protein